MDYFNYQDDGQLFAELCAVADVAKKFGTPTYVYSRATIERHWHAFNDAAGEHPHLVCYAVKANSNIAVLNVMARLGSGFDIVSGGELLRVIAAGGDPSKIVFSGVGKTVAEINLALDHQIHCFNVESTSELERINEVALSRGVQAPVSIRVNPNIDAGTHPYISTGLKENKFGIDIDLAEGVYQAASKMAGIKLNGVDCHIGSQLTELSPFLEAVDKLLVLIDKLSAQGIVLAHLDVGGGLGVPYEGETPPLPAEYAQALKDKLAGRKLALIFEPGRAIMANAGILVSKVEYIKLTEHKNFAIVDAAMNDLIRPALYSAWQAIVPVNKSLVRESRNYDVVGPICETGDFLGKNRDLTIAMDDYIVVRSAGAYGSTMSSNYNSRSRPAEVMVDGDVAHLIRRREELAEIWKDETILPA
ncbi:diaminopimelate decarboxylase [Moritella sp. F3]|uniref:diaminopimelate decarboxylase n=1 Tax=Moritella sp. F3 TaxID=2718882 RepID=UPI0018E0E856|nr:diaminopimelate decarboxylase [Moritella sp. F3]GIC77335.1 diaminopimelate decarboxylase [Moritella sp. F1]GIC83258.1 diaminopimelate decarboxylase [Moritella sp. F3]